MNGPYMQEAKARAARVGLEGCFIFSQECPPIYGLAENGVDIVIDINATEHYYAAATCAPHIPNSLTAAALDAAELGEVIKVESVEALLNDLNQALRDSTEEASQLKEMVNEVEHALGHFSTASAEAVILPPLEEDYETRI